MEDEFRPADQWDKEVLQAANQARKEAAKQRKKSRKSMGRRVSFAPDAQLETMHLYTQEAGSDQNTDPEVGNRRFSLSKHTRVEIKSSVVAEYGPPSGYVESQQTVRGTELMERGNEKVTILQSPIQELEQRVIGEVTRDVPSIADLLQFDGETETLAVQNEDTGAIPQFRVPGEITSGVPTLADLLQSDGETEQLADVSIGQSPLRGSQAGVWRPSQSEAREIDTRLTQSPADQPHPVPPELDGAEEYEDRDRQQNQVVEEPDSPDLLADSPQEDGPRDDSNQINKWGFAPGEDDTQDLNLERKGRLIMGDNTYKHVYENQTESTRDVTTNWADAAMSPAQLDTLFKRADSASQILRSAIKSNLDSPGSARKRSMLGRESLLGFQPSTSSPASRLEQVQANKGAWPKSRLSDAFSKRSVMAQQPIDQGFQDDGSQLPSGFEPTPMSRHAPDSGQLSGQLRGSEMKTGDLLTGDVYAASPGRGRSFTPSGSLPVPSPVPMTGLLSAEKPLIDLGTPQAERLRSMGGKSPRNMVDAFSSMPVKKKSRMSIMSTGNDSTGRLIEGDDLTDELLQQDDQDDDLNSAVPPSLLKSTGKDMTTRLLLEDTLNDAPSPQFQVGGHPWGQAMHLRAFAAAAGSPSQKHRSPRPPVERTMVTERLLEDTSITPARSRLANSSLKTFSQPEISQPSVPPKSSSALAPPEQMASQISPPVPATAGQDLPPVQQLAGSATPEVIPAGARLRGRKSMDVLPGRAGTEMLEDITFDVLDAAPSSPPPPQQRQPSNEIQLTPSVFPGGALLQRTPVGKKRKEAMADSVVEPPMTRHRAQVLASGGKVSSPKVQSPAPSKQKPKSATKVAQQQIVVQSPGNSKQRSTPQTRPPTHPNTSSVNKQAIVTRSAAKAMQTPSGTQRGTHRLARTPIRPAYLENMTLHDFLREVDIHFLDHMRRGASLNLADLAQDPPPSGLQDSYTLMCITAPECGQFEDGIQTLQNEIAARKASAKEKEDEFAAERLPIFDQLAAASQEDHEIITAGAQALKKLCRVRTNLSWKEWRVTMEAQRCASLQAKLQVLKHDEGFLQSNLKYLKELGSRITSFSAEQKQTVQARKEAHAKELARRIAVTQLRQSLEVQQQQNAERALNKADLDEEVVMQRAQYGMLEARRAEVQARLAALQSKIQASQEAMAAHKKREVTPEDLASQLQQLDILQGCSRWSIHSHPDVTVETGLLLKFDVYFQLSIVFDRQSTGSQDESASARASLNVTAQEIWPKRARQYHATAAQLMKHSLPQSTSLSEGSLNFVNSTRVTSQDICSVVQEITPGLRYLADALSDLQRIHSTYPSLCRLTLGDGGSLHLTFSNAENLSRVRVSLLRVLQPPDFGEPLQCDVTVDMPGQQNLTTEIASKTIEEVSTGTARLRRTCQALQGLVGKRMVNKAEASTQVKTAGRSSSTFTAIQQETTGLSTQEVTAPVVEAATDAENLETDQQTSLNFFSNPLYNTLASARKPAQI